mgnify:CR=1 FL=1
MNLNLNKINKTINLVTGGAGFLGSHLIDKLMLLNEKVICLDNFFTGSKDNIKDLFQYEDFEFIKHGPKDINNQPTPPNNADFALKAYGTNCGEILDHDLQNLRPKSWHWIKSKIDVEVLKYRFNQLDYSMSKDTVRQDSLGQQELIHLYKIYIST